MGTGLPWAQSRVGAWAPSQGLKLRWGWLRHKADWRLGVSIHFWVAGPPPCGIPGAGAPWNTQGLLIRVDAVLSMGTRRDLGGDKELGSNPNLLSDPQPWCFCFSGFQMISKCASCSKLMNISFLPRYQERHLWDITEAGPDQNSCGRALLDPRYKSGPFLAGWGLRIMAVCPVGTMCSEWAGASRSVSCV